MVTFLKVRQTCVPNTAFDDQVSFFVIILEHGITNGQFAYSGPSITMVMGPDGLFIALLAAHEVKDLDHFTIGNEGNIGSPCANID